MKRIVLFALAFIFATTSFAQKGKLRSAISAYEDGDYQTAYKAIIDASKHDKTKDLPETWVYKAQILSMVKSAPQIQSLLGIEVNDDELLQALDKVKALDAEGKFKKDLADAAMVIVQNTHNAGVVAFNDEKDYQKAADLFQQKIDLRKAYMPDAGIDTIDYLIIGASQFELDYKAEAIKNYEKLVELRYPDKAVYYTLYNEYKASESDEDLLRILKEGQDAFPEETNFRLLEIDYYIQQGKTNEIMDKMISALEDDPDNIALLLSIASVYEQEQNYEKQEEYAKKALEVDPSNFAAGFNLGVAYFNRAVKYNDEMNFMTSTSTPEYKDAKVKRDKLAAQAIPYFEKAYEQNPNDPAVLLALIQYHRMHNNKAKKDKFQAEYDALP